MFRVGIIGLGKQGRNHAQRLWPAPEFRVTHGYERTRSGAPISGLTYAETVEALCAAVDVVVIATPSATHFELAEQALSAGKHVVVEKPTALSLRETQRLVALAEENNLALLTHFNRRWDPDFLIVKETIGAGLLGAVHTIESRVSDDYDCSGTYPKRAAWKKQRPGGGILLDWGPHLFDQLFELWPDETPEAIFCHTERRIGATEPDVDEQFSVTVFYADRTAVLTATWNAALPMPRWHVVSRHGTLRIERGAKARLRFLKGQSVSEETIDAANKQGSFSAYTVEAIKNAKLRRKELDRSLHVAQALDLARDSSRTRQCLPWRDVNPVRFFQINNRSGMT